MARPHRDATWLALGVLTLGSVVNLAAGARRPLLERATLGGDHNAAANSAALAVNQFVPKDRSISLVVYDDDLLGELDCAIWADYRLKWLCYPRTVEVYRWSSTGDPYPDRRYVELGIHPDAIPDQDRYLLFFRVTAPPERSRGPLQFLARGNCFLLAREPVNARLIGARQEWKTKRLESSGS